MGDVASSMRWTLSANWANLPFLTSRICDSTSARTDGHVHSFFLMPTDDLKWTLYEKSCGIDLPT